MTVPPTRREYLAAIGTASAVGLAGCSSSETDEDSTETTSPGASDDEGTADDSMQGDEGTADDSMQGDEGATDDNMQTEESTDGSTQADTDGQPTNRIQIVSTVGTAISERSVGSVEVTVKRAPGAADIDLSETVLQFVSAAGSVDLTFGSTGGTGSASEFGVQAIQDAGETSLVGDSPTLDDPADRAQVVLDTRSMLPSTGGLEEGDTATVQFTTPSGGTTELRLVVPETLSGMNAVNL